MSAIEYTKCDGAGCGNVTPDDPHDAAWDRTLRWGQLIVGGKAWDLCPECAGKAKKAAGVDR